MKNYTIEQIEQLMKDKQPIDMTRVSMEELNPTATQYMRDCEKGEKKARDAYLELLLQDSADPVKCLAWIQLYDFCKNSKEGVKYNFIQFENKLKQYNAGLETQKEKKA